MALVYFDRVQETTATTGTGTITLGGAVSGYQSFAVVGNGNTCYYTIADGSGNWEVGLGTYSTTGPTLGRTTVLSSSNSGSKVSFPAGIGMRLTVSENELLYLTRMRAFNLKTSV